MEDQILAVIFEGDTCKGWIDQLSRRMQKQLTRAENNKVILTENWYELQEMRQAATALRRASTALTKFSFLAAQVEGKPLRQKVE